MNLRSTLGWVRLVFGNFRLCDGCSKGVHADHRPIHCQCDICEET